MENSRLIEILRLVINGLEENRDVHIDYLCSSGICNHINRLHYDGKITEDEKLLVRAFIKMNKPNKERFTKYTTGKYWKDGIFWWIPISQERKTTQIRINYLNELIKSING